MLYYLLLLALLLLLILLLLLLLVLQVLLHLLPLLLLLLLLLPIPAPATPGSSCPPDWRLSEGLGCNGNDVFQYQLKVLYRTLERERDHCTTLVDAGVRVAVFRRAVHRYRLRGLVHTRRGCPLFQVAQQHMIPCAAGCLCSDITYRSLLWRHSRQRGHRLRSRGDEDLATRCRIRHMLMEPLAEALDHRFDIGRGTNSSS